MNDMQPSSMNHKNKAKWFYGSAFLSMNQEQKLRGIWRASQVSLTF